MSKPSLAFPKTEALALLDELHSLVGQHLGAARLEYVVDDEDIAAVDAAFERLRECLGARR